MLTQVRSSQGRPYMLRSTGARPEQGLTLTWRSYCKRQDKNCITTAGYTASVLAAGKLCDASRGHSVRSGLLVVTVAAWLFWITQCQSFWINSRGEDSPRHHMQPFSSVSIWSSVIASVGGKPSKSVHGEASTMFWRTNG